jgi:hypothetical protein
MIAGGGRQGGGRAAYPPLGKWGRNPASSATGHPPLPNRVVPSKGYGRGHGFWTIPRWGVLAVRHPLDSRSDMERKKEP